MVPLLVLGLLVRRVLGRYICDVLSSICSPEASKPVCLDMNEYTVSASSSSASTLVSIEFVEA